MLAKLLFWFLFTKYIEAQLNGDFWWLNSKVSEFHGKQIPQPQFEDLTEFDTDDSRITFNDDNFHIMKHGIIDNVKNERQFKMKPDHMRSKRKKVMNSNDKIIFTQTKMDDRNKIVWPSDGVNNKNDFKNVASTNSFSEPTTKKNIVTSTAQDQFAIVFPERDSFYVPKAGSKIISTSTEGNIQTTLQAVETTSEMIKRLTDVIFFDNTESVTERAKETKSICSYIKKHDCLKHNGFIYTAEYGKSLKAGPKDPTLVCCILTVPLKKEIEKSSPNPYDESMLYFPGKITRQERHKRSNNELKQRNVLLQRKQQQGKTKSTATQTKIVTPEDDEDPYWNIKNVNIHPTKKPLKTIDYDYKEDFIQEYADELPRPGLVGLYSDRGRKTASWMGGKQEQSYGEDADYDDVDDSDTSFGYGSIDPRQENTKKSKKRNQPLKLNTPEKKYNPESHIITFQSNPNFEVLQGFKLLNLASNNNYMAKRMNDQSDMSDYSEDEEAGAVTITKSPESSFKDNIQLFSGCGVTTSTKLKQKDAQVGEAEQGSHTWLIVVTPANDPQDILCYGTLIHPRAAITTADCVYESSQDNIVVVAGLWKLNEISSTRKRSPEVHLHPKFRPGSVANNLAILTWTRPFKLCDEIQTACLAEPRLGRDCMMFGWGGFDQALRLRSRWQKARMHECNQMPSLKKENIPSNAFCATVQSRGTVSGVGGPMICNVNGRDAVVGVAVSRDIDVVFLPARDWAMQAEKFVTED